MKRLNRAIMIVLGAAVFLMISAALPAAAQGTPAVWRADGSFLIGGSEALRSAEWIFTMALSVTAAGGLFGISARRGQYNRYLRTLYQGVIENANVGISIANNEGEYEYMNESYQKILDINDPDAQLKTCTDLMEPGAAAHMEEIERSGEKDTAGQFVFSGSGAAPGEDRCVRYHHFALCDQDDQQKNVNMLCNVSEMEQMKRRLEEQLKQIRYYSSVKDIFLANISHEIKTPLNAIVGTLYFLKETPLSAQQRDLVEKIENASDMLLALVNDVLDFSKIKEQKMDLYPTAFSLAEMLHSVENLFYPQLEQKKLRWKRQMDFNPQLGVYLDRTRLIQVLANLVGNACKFTEEGYVLLGVKTVEESEKQVTLEFSVEDSGIGIAGEDIPKLFQEFKQLENHLTKRHTGTGLGLAICKRIVQEMGGSIEVESKPGVGSRFFFTITAPKVSPEEVHCDSGSAAGTEGLDGSGARILVAEDMEINREITVNLLKDVNAECDVAQNGQEAVQCCRKHGADYYDVILMDIHMPEMDGYTASDILKNELHVTAPIIALTATEVDDETRLKHRDTISGFITKPFQVETFYGTLRNYLVREPKREADPFAGKAEAIRNMGGTEEQYQKYVARFQESNQNVMDKLVLMLRRGADQEAHRCVHSIKGTAGMLGMTALHEKAAVLSEAIAEGKQEEIPDALTAFDLALQEVLGA